MDLSRFLEAARQGCVDPHACTRYYKDSPSPPPAPDYTGAAVAQQKSQMSSQYTPYGNQVYLADPNSPSGYQSNITLAPQAQQTLDSQMALSQNLGNLANTQLGRVNAQYGQPMDLSSVPQIADKAYSAMTSRLDPQWSQREEQQKAQLANQGLVPGGEAYDNAMRDFNSARNDAYQQANLGAIQTMPQTYQLATSAYNQPLNTLNAIRTGAQVQNPQFSTQPGANMLGAAQSEGQYGQGLYNAQVGQQNAMTSGLFGLGGAIGQGYAMSPTGSAAISAMFSDRRLKTNIVRVGTHPLGFGVYEYDIFGEHQRGVMADEVEQVMPAAVITGADGFKRVYYGML